MDFSDIAIKTKNLLLVPIGMEYKEEIFREFTPEITLYMYPKPADKIEETIEFIQSSLKGLKNGTNLQLVILDGKTKEFLGCCGLHKVNTLTPELGVWVKKTAHGNKFGREAMAAVKEWADKNIEYDHISYPVAEKNIASRKIPESLGGRVGRESDETTLSGNTWRYLEYRIFPVKSKNAIPSEFKLIIFDLDGLLVDSQPLQYEAYNRVFSECGQPISEKDWIDYWIHGPGGPKAWIENRHLDLDYQKMRAEKKIIYDELIQTKMKLKPGAKELVNLLYEEFPLVVASSSRIESIELCLKKFGLIDKFKRLISDAEMERGKPHPDVFLYTAKMMKVEPKDCLVFEDYLAGLKSAKSAGMKCIICPDSFSSPNIEQYKGADKIVGQLTEVNLDVIKSLGEMITTDAAKDDAE